MNDCLPRSPWRSSRTTRGGLARATRTSILAASVLLWPFASGCGDTVIIRQGSPVRIAEPVHVLQLEGGEWVRSARKVDIRGWYAVSPEEVE